MRLISAGSKVQILSGPPTLLKFSIAALSLFFVSLCAAEVAIPKIEFKHSKLENGLEIYTVEDHASPTVAVQVWYHVGSKDDPQGRSGFASLFLGSETQDVLSHTKVPVLVTR